jgi:threonine dehydrogenase-like Zn-dependent dehydrogenase
MRALVWRGGQRLEYGEVPEPMPEPDEVVVDVELAGICGSDLHAYKGSPGPRVPPLVLGHEVVGTVDGSRVVVYPLIGCGECGQCSVGNENLCSTWQLIGMHRPGVFAERVCVPERCVIHLPEGMPSARAVLSEPLACGVGALRLDGADSRGRILVLGCGPIGLLVVMLIARRGGEAVAIDPLPERQFNAQRAGATAVAAAYSAAEHGVFDVAVDAAGFELSWRAGIDSLRPHGELVVLGLGQPEGSFPMATVVRRAIRVRGHFAYSRADFAAALDVLGDPNLGFEWIDEVPLSEGPVAFENLAQRPAQFTKVLLRP